MGLDVSEGPPGTEETSRLIQRQRWIRFVWVLVVLAILVGISGATTWIRDALAWPLGQGEQPQKADVIIVLGSGTRTSGDHLPLQAKQRVTEGVQLWQAGWAQHMIVSGGLDSNTNLVEADAMADYAVKSGMDPAYLVEERESTDTYTNAKDSLAIMAEKNWLTADVVTSPYHVWRSCRIFRHQHATVQCVAAPFSLLPSTTFLDRLLDTKSVVREYGAIIYNAVKGQL